MTEDSFNRTLSFNTKFKYFLASWALVEVVLIDAVYKFMGTISYLGVFEMPSESDFSFVLWGESIPYNLLKLLIVSVFAFIFGLSYAYTARKVRESDKTSISIINALVAVFGWFIIIIIIFWLTSATQDYQIGSAISELVDVISESPLYSGFIIAQFICVAFSTYLGLTYGQKKIEPLNHEDRGRLLGVKWYHYLWLWPAISTYIQSLLLLIYVTIKLVLGFFTSFKIGEAVSSTVSGEDNGSSFSGLLAILFIAYLIAIMILNLLNYLRKILAGEIKLNIYLKILLSISIAFIIPMLLVIFTIVGDSRDV